MARNTKKKRSSGKVLLVNMEVGRVMTCLDVVQLPSSIADNEQIVGELASSYKRTYIAHNPQFAKNEFTWQVKSLR